MKEKQTLLIVDDNMVSQKILSKILMDEYSIISAKNGQEALDLLTACGRLIDAVILDLVMPVMNGFEFLEKVYGIDTYRNLPIIMSTGNDSEEHETKALSLGAWDFISKPYHAEILKFRLKNAIARSQLSALQELKYLAEYDTLTGLYNKNKFFSTTREMLDQNSTKHFVFIRFDIDRFQLVNAFFGIEEGDRLLCYLADQFRVFLESNELCTYGRMEADIFACCVEYHSKGSLLKSLEDAAKIVRAYNLSFDLVPTFGLYYLNNLQLPLNVMLDRATLAAKSRKDSYIDIIGEYVPEMSRRIAQEQEIVNEMVAALARGQFEIYIQPKYDLASNLPAGGEALVRWNHPQKGIISPGVFIPVFEKNGFISKLDYYVWEEVCRLFRKWIDAGNSNPHPISVNVSRVNLYNPQIVENIGALLEKYSLPPRLLELELTESAYTDNPLVMRVVVERLREKGFTVLMDDFGTGYSSLSILKDIEVDILKIDMHFLEDSPIPGRGENIIASIIRMAKWLNIPTVAEGVEKPEQIEFLRSIGCEYVQGYIFAKPMPVADFEELARNNAEKEVHPVDSFDLDSLWDATPQMELLFSNATQATCLYEAETGKIEILRVNRVFHRLFPQETLSASNSLLEAIRPEYRAEVLAAFQKCMDLQGFSECDYRMETPDQSAKWINLKLQCLKKMGSRHIIFGTLFDITPQKNIEEELKKYKNVAKEDAEETNRLIVVSTSKTECACLSDILRKRFTVLTARNSAEVLELLEEHDSNVDLILIDDLLPAEEEKNILDYQPPSAEGFGIPLLKIVSYSDFSQHEHLIAHGISDLIMKPFPSSLLLRRVENVLGSQRRLREVRREYELALEQAQLDPLTQVLNRSSAERKITATLSLQAGRMHALLMLDLDDFKQVNDTYGHTCGDRMLLRLATKLKDFFRKGDIIARFGGDEFCVFLENITSEEFVMNKASRLCHQIGLLEVGEEKLHPACSIGIALTNADACTFETLYKTADLALYESQHRGKNTVTLYGDEKQMQLPEMELFLGTEWLLDELDSAFYLIEPISNRTLYASSAGLSLLQAQDYHGKSCYELIHGRKEPCLLCARDLKEEDGHCQWTEDSVFLQKSFTFMDKLVDLNGRKLILRIVQNLNPLQPNSNAPRRERERGGFA